MPHTSSTRLKQRRDTTPCVTRACSSQHPLRRSAVRWTSGRTIPGRAHLRTGGLVSSVTRHNSRAHILDDCASGFQMRPKTETNSAATAAWVTKRTRIAPGQWRWRWDLNPRRGCPLTRFRVLRTSVHQWPPPSVTCPNMIGVVAGERCRTGVNETETETGDWTAFYGAALVRSDAPLS